MGSLGLPDPGRANPRRRSVVRVPRKRLRPIFIPVAVDRSRGGPLGDPRSGTASRVRCGSIESLRSLQTARAQRVVAVLRNLPLCRGQDFLTTGKARSIFSWPGVSPHLPPSEWLVRNRGASALPERIRKHESDVASSRRDGMQSTAIPSRRGLHPALPRWMKVCRAG